MKSLTQILNTQLTTDSSKVILKDLRTDHEWDKKTVLETRNALVKQLSQNGVRPGDVVLTSIPNSAEAVIVMLALYEMHVISYTIDPNMSASELTTILHRQNYAAAFLGEHHRQMLSELYQSSGEKFSVHPVVINQLDLGFYTVKNQLRHANPRIQEFMTQYQSSLGILMYTSGTTGLPKAVVLTHAQLLAAAEDIIRAQELDDRDRTLVMLPLFHINAQVISVLSTLISGGTLIIAPKFSASHFWSTMKEEKITWVSAAPAIIAILLRTNYQPGSHLPLRFIRSASAPLPVMQEEAFKKRFNVPVIQSYGMTEAASQITINPIERQKVGSVGRSSGSELKIVSEKDQPLSANQVGEIIIRGTHVITRYLEAKNQDDFVNGWLHTGDVGYLDEDGYLFIVGRKRELINRSGDKVSPIEVENTLLQIPIVESAAVVGLPDPIYGEHVVAAVILKDHTLVDDAIKEQLIAYTNDHLSRFKRPDQIVFMNQFPTGPTGKIQRTKIKNLLVNQSQLIKGGLQHG